jgi:hypothetical protein
MAYVICPECGDPVAGKLAGELTCGNCKKNFLFDKSQEMYGPLHRNQKTGRWEVG